MKRFNQPIPSPLKNLVLSITTVVCFSAVSSFSHEYHGNGGHGSTADIWTAAAAGDLVSIKRFLAHGDDLDIRHPITNATPLQSAVFNSQSEIVSFFIENGSDVNARDLFGNTPLIIAAFIGNVNVAEKLIKADADVTLRNHSFFSALEILQTSWPETEKLLQDLNVAPISKEEVFTGRKKIDSLLLEAYQNVAEKDIWFAVIMGMTELVKKHVTNYEDINTLKTDIGVPLLHVATTYNHPSVVELLLEAGANVNATDHLGTSPLLLAAILGHAKVARVLLDSNADVTVTNLDGATLQTLLDLDWPATLLITNIVQVHVDPTTVRKGRVKIREYLNDLEEFHSNDKP